MEVLKKEIESTGFKVVEVTTSSQFIYIQGISGVFDNDADLIKIVKIIDLINENAVVA